MTQAPELPAPASPGELDREPDHLVGTGVGYPEGVSFEHRPRVPLPDAQRETNQRGLALVRATLAAKRNRNQ